jgi:hypothetical protein
MGHPTMPRAKGENDGQVTLTLPSKWLDEAEELSETMRRPGMVIVRADVLRMAMRIGLDSLADEAKKPARKR